MDEPSGLGGEHLAADDRVFVNEQGGLDLPIPGGIVGHLIGIPLHPLALVIGQVESLGRLQLYVLAVAVVQLLRMMSSSTDTGCWSTTQP